MRNTAHRIRPVRRNPPCRLPKLGLCRSHTVAREYGKRFWRIHIGRVRNSPPIYMAELAKAGTNTSEQENT